MKSVRKKVSHYMNNFKINSLLTLFAFILLTGCATAPGFKSLGDNPTYELSYIIKYPSFTGTTKEAAKKQRKQYLEKTMLEVLESIYRIGYFELNRYSYSNNRTPFKVVESKPLTFKHSKYYYNSQGHENPIGYEGDIPKWKWSKHPDLIVTPQDKQLFFEQNFPLINRGEMESALNKFSENYYALGGKTLFQKFLKEIQFHRIASKAPETNPSIFNIFKSYKNVSPTGMGVAEVEKNEKNVLNFILNKYKHYPYDKSTSFSLNYDPVKFLWGTMLVLNSELSINRVNKDTVKVDIVVPIDNMTRKYNVQKVSKYIEL